MAKRYANPFVAGGPLRRADRAVHIIRDAEKEVYNLLRGGKFVSLAESRQQGISSLINRLPLVLGRKTPVIVVRAMDHQPGAHQQWFQTIGGAICRGLQNHPNLLPHDVKLEPLTNREHWADFLTAVARTVSSRTVIVLDELEAIRFDDSNHFYSVIRNVRDDSRGKVAFVLAGCFHPHHLITDERVAPFNGAPRVRLPDFTEEEVARLASKLPQQSQSSTIAERVYYWAGGHPYITQFLLWRMAEEGTGDDVESRVDYFVAEDVLNLSRIRAELDKQENLDLCKTLSQILNRKERIGISEAAPYSAATRLRLLGLVSPDRGHICQIRNRVYERMLRDLFPQHEVFISYRSEDAAWAIPFLKELEQGETRCFFAPRNLPPGADFPLELRGAVSSARCLALLLNRRSLVECANPRDWVRIEVEQAIQSGITIVPVMIQDCPEPNDGELPDTMKKIAVLNVLRLTLENVAAVAAAIRKKVRGET